MKLNVDVNNSIYGSVDGVVFNKEQTSIVIVPSGRAEYTITEFVENVEEYAFQGL